MKSLTVKVSESTYAELDRYVRRNGQTKNGLINALIGAFLHGPHGVSGTPLVGTHSFWALVGTIQDRADVSAHVDTYLHGRRKKA